MRHDPLPAESPLAKFIATKAAHQNSTNLCECSFGDLHIEPSEQGVQIYRKEDLGRSRVNVQTYNLSELQWLHNQLGRLLGR